MSSVSSLGSNQEAYPFNAQDYEEAKCFIKNPHLNHGFYSYFISDMYPKAVLLLIHVQTLHISEIHCFLLQTSGSAYICSSVSTLPCVIQKHNPVVLNKICLSQNHICTKTHITLKLLLSTLIHVATLYMYILPHMWPHCCTCIFYYLTQSTSKQQLLVFTPPQRTPCVPFACCCCFSLQHSLINMDFMCWDFLQAYLLPLKTFYHFVFFHHIKKNSSTPTVCIQTRHDNSM